MAKRHRRTGIQQSRSGCRTCKARKVKCDELKPCCNNCARGGRRCEYNPLPVNNSSSIHIDTANYLNIPMTPITESSSPARTAASYSTSPASFNFNNSPMAPPVAGIMSQVDGVIARARELVLGSYIDDFGFFSDILDTSFLNYDYLCNSTRYAAAAVDAAGEHLKLVEFSQSSVLAIATYSEYNNAIASLREEFEMVSDYSRSSIPLTIIFLVCVELMLRRRQDAMLHLSSLSKLLLQTRAAARTTISQQQILDLHVLLRSLEIHKMASADHVVPYEVIPIRVHAELLPPGDLKSLGKHTINIIHASHAYIYDVSLSTSSDQLSSGHKAQQDLLLNQISQTCSVIAQLLLHPGSDQNLSHLRRLQCICLSMYIELANLFSESEDSFDNYAQQFEVIITNAERILSSRHHNNRQLGHPAFSLQLGITQPLYYAATKYRRRSWRNKAISCLEKAGQEGPWHGPLLASVARRCVEYEESFVPSSTAQIHQPLETRNETLESYRNLLTTYAAAEEPSSIPVHGRITAARFAEDSSVQNFDWETDRALTNSPNSMTMTKVMFIQRVAGISAIPAHTFSCIDYLQDVRSAGVLPTFLDLRQWHTWSENISF